MPSSLEDSEKAATVASVGGSVDDGKDDDDKKDDGLPKQGRMPTSLSTESDLLQRLNCCYGIQLFRIFRNSLSRAQTFPCHRAPRSLA
jgi:hypothetical protein